MWRHRCPDLGFNSEPLERVVFHASARKVRKVRAISTFRTEPGPVPVMTSSFLLGALAIGVLSGFVAVLAGSLLWRVNLWKMPAIEQLHTVEGLSIGRKAPDIAATNGTEEYHLTFQRKWTFLVFGSEHCAPCKDLLRVALDHPATRGMRFVYLASVGEGPHTADEASLSCRTGQSWEFYNFHDETHVRKQWRAPVSPYYHVINPSGRVVAKGVASKPAHLDRLLGIAMAALVERSAQIAEVET